LFARERAMSAIEEQMYVTQLQESLLDCDRLNAEAILNDAMNRLGLKVVFNSLIPRTLNSIGQRWVNGDVALTQIYASSRIIEDAIQKIFPSRTTSEEKKCKVVVAALDYHGLGKNILARFLNVSGVEVIDLGTSVPAEIIVDEAIKNKADAILVSALMLHACLDIGRIKQILNNRGANLPLIVGGAPFTFDAELWKKVSADAMGKSVCMTFKELKGLLKK